MATQMANPRADEQEGPIRPSAWGESAPEDEAHSFSAYGKGHGCAEKVHALIRPAFVLRTTAWSEEESLPVPP